MKQKNKIKLKYHKIRPENSKDLKYSYGFHEIDFGESQNKSLFGRVYIISYIPKWPTKISYKKIKKKMKSNWASIKHTAP